MGCLYGNSFTRERLAPASSSLMTTAVFAEALCAYLEKTFDVIGLVADGRAMLEESIRLRPDVIVTDVSMPLLNGLDAARRIREKTPNVKFVFLTMLDDLNLAAAALELGPSLLF